MSSSAPLFLLSKMEVPGTTEEVVPHTPETMEEVEEVLGAVMEETTEEEEAVEVLLDTTEEETEGTVEVTEDLSREETGEKEEGGRTMEEAVTGRATWLMTNTAPLIPSPSS